MPTPLLLVSGATTCDPVWDALAVMSFINRVHMAQRFPGVYAGCTEELPDYDIVGERPPSWRKLPLLWKMSAESVATFAERPAILWMDVDCWLTREATPEAFAPESQRMRTLMDCNGLNCGAMLFPPEDWVPQFLEWWWYAARPEEVNHPWWEQATLHRLVSVAPPAAARIGVPLPSECFVHAAGVPARDKLAWLKAHALEV